MGHCVTCGAKLTLNQILGNRSRCDVCQFDRSRWSFELVACPLKPCGTFRLSLDSLESIGATDYLIARIDAETLVTWS